MTTGISPKLFPFFVSCGRSGSTLLRSIFDSHPELAVPGESYFITELLPRRRLYEKNGFDATRFIDDVIELSWTTREDELTWIDKWGIDKQHLRQTVIEGRPSTYADAVRCVFQCYADWKGKPLYGDKTPAYITSMEQIIELLPEARFVHLVRDGRNVALAFLSAPFGPHTIEEIALHWRARAMAGRKAGRRMGLSRYMEIRYEDLVAHPKESVQTVCDWLGISFHDSMLDHRESVKGLGLGFDKAHKSVLRPIQKGLRDWTTQMDKANLEKFEGIAGDALEMFGYDRAIVKPRTSMQVRIMARRSYLSGVKLSRRVRGLKSAEWW